MKNISFLFVSFFLIISCANPTAQKQVQQVNGLIQTVDSCEKVFNQLKFEEVKSYKETAEKQLDFLEENYHDTNFEHAKYVGVYYDNWKLMRNFGRAQGKLEKEITYTQSQLQHLKEDAKNNLFNDSTFHRNFQAEFRATLSIKETTKALVDWQERTIKRYNGMHAPIDSIILELNKQGYR